MKDVELRLVSELMKNSHRSDRDLGKAVGASQPTVTRARSRLEREGIIKEYTMLPDFSKLGFEIMAITFIRFIKELTPQELQETREYSKEIEKKHPEALLMIAEGMGLGFDRVIISLHRNYSSYVKVIDFVKTQARYINASHIESFVIGLADGVHYRPLTFSLIANYLSKTKEEKPKKNQKTPRRHKTNESQSLSKKNLI